jgi:hypothetical protein
VYGVEILESLAIFVNGLAFFNADMGINDGFDGGDFIRLDAHPPVINYPGTQFTISTIADRLVKMDAGRGFLIKHIEDLILKSGRNLTIVNFNTVGRKL